MLDQVSLALAVSCGSPWVRSVKTFDSPHQVLWEHSPLLCFCMWYAGIKGIDLFSRGWIGSMPLVHRCADRAVPQHSVEAGEVRVAVPGGLQ